MNITQTVTPFPLVPPSFPALMVGTLDSKQFTVVFKENLNEGTMLSTTYPPIPFGTYRADWSTIGAGFVCRPVEINLVQ